MPNNGLEDRGDIAPSTHVLGFFLTPHEPGSGILLGDDCEALFVERVELFDSHDSGIFDVLFVAIIAEIVVNLTRTENETLGLRGSVFLFEDFVELATGEFVEARDRFRMTEQRLGGHNHEWTPKIALHLSAQKMKILCRRGRVGHLDIILGAGIEEAFDPS